MDATSSELSTSPGGQASAGPETMRTGSAAEGRFLRLSAGGNLVLGVLGIAFAALSQSQAILLEGLYNLIYLIAALFTLRVARLVHREDDERFPYGYAYFEPLMNGVKGTLVAGVSLMALAGAIEALLTGGRSISADLAVIFAVIATAVCFVLMVLIRRGARQCGSPLLRADAENWGVGTAVLAGVIVAFLGIVLLRESPYRAMAVYVDPAIVIVVVAITIGIPVRMAWQSLMQLLNRAPPEAVSREVVSIVEAATAGLPVEELFVRTLQPGRTRIVLAHVVLPANYRVESLAAFDAVRRDCTQSLQQAHPATILDMLFTSDRLWGAPVATDRPMVADPPRIGSPEHSRSPEASAQTETGRNNADR